MGKSKSKAAAKAEAEKPRADVAGSVQPPGDGSLALFLVSEFRTEQPQFIDVFPIDKHGDKLERLFHYDVKQSERIEAMRAAELAADIDSRCQIHCDTFGRKRSGSTTGHNYVVLIIDNKRGGVANPAGALPIHKEPRPFQPISGRTSDGEEREEEEDETNAGLSALKIMQETVRLVHTRERDERENEGKIVGETLLIQKDALKDREELISKLFDKNLEMADKFLDMAKIIGERSVEARAVEIDAKNAEEDRKDRQAARERDNLGSDVMRAGLMEGIKVLGELFPGFGQLFIAHLKGGPMPTPPQLTGGTAPSPDTTPVVTSTATTVAAAGTTAAAAPPVPEEVVIVRRLIASLKERKVDEKLFGKDDENGNPVEPGIFTRDQVAILSGVNTGKLGPEALDPLVPDFGKPEAVQPVQIVRAMAYFNQQNLDDVMHFVRLRKEAAAAAQAK